MHLQLHSVVHEREWMRVTELYEGVIDDGAVELMSRSGGGDERQK